VKKLVLAMRGPLDVAAVRARCQGLSLQGVLAVAICYELDAGDDGLAAGLSAQRAITAALREIYGADAEQVAIFVARDREGERLADIARDWEATEVIV
jgi:hypothetical protein